LKTRIEKICYALATLLLGAGVVAVAAFAADSVEPANAQQPEAHTNVAEWQMLDRYCSDCHNATDWAGGVAFDTMTPDGVADEAKIWEEAVRKLRGRLMPPPGKPQPEQPAVDALVSWLETRLDQSAEGHPNPGHVVLHRLNRNEYARAVESMLALKIDPAALLPKDTKSEGFDNVASVLKVSPSFLDQYIYAARDVSVQAIGVSSPAPASKVYRASPSGQDSYIEGLPLGTRGGMLAEHYFPADGEYTFNLNNTGGGGSGYVAGLDDRQKLLMTIDGVKVFEGELGGAEDLKAVDQQQAVAAKAIRDRFQNIRVPVKAGPRKIGVTFVAKTFAESEESLQPLGVGALGRNPIITGFEVVGPYHPVGISPTPSRQQIFVCRPTTPDEELPCAEQILAKLARQAFRRPVSAADLQAPLRFYRNGRANGDFDAGIQQGLMAILASPKFLYRIEPIPQDAAPGTVYHIGDLELASRLAFFLWSQGPDEQLLDVAEAGKLHDPRVLEQQVQRMLADPKSSSLVSNFASQWLNVDKIDDIDPDPSLFPEFDASLRAAFHRETELFVDSILREDRSVIDLLTANHTFVNERLALHYDIPNIRGPRFRRITLPDSRRWGLLGKGSFLMSTSYANRTAPVLRGAWILENITGTPPAAPPPGVETLKENQAGAKALTVRELMVQHRANPSCNACHGIMDPLGFALENFDAVGKWRAKDRDAGTVIDSSGELHGIPMNGPDDLRNALTARPDQFAQTVTEKLMIYALGRGIEFHDMPAVRTIVRNAAADRYRFSSLIAGIVKSEPFAMSTTSSTSPVDDPANAPSASNQGAAAQVATKAAPQAR
jgi:mono/diheme cytochrome c family protein